MRPIKNKRRRDPRYFLNESIDPDNDGSLDPEELRNLAADLEGGGASEDQDNQHLLSDPDVGGRRGLNLLIQLKKLTPDTFDGPAELYDFLSDAGDGDHGQELDDLLYDIYSNTHLSIEDIVDYWSSI